DLVLPLGIRYSSAHPLDERRAAGFNGDARKHGAGRVAHHAGDRRLRLCENGTRRKDEKDTEGKGGPSLSDDGHATPPSRNRVGVCVADLRRRGLVYTTTPASRL